jgi:hypothetical protein
MAEHLAEAIDITINTSEHWLRSSRRNELKAIAAHLEAAYQIIVDREMFRVGKS